MCCEWCGHSCVNHVISATTIRSHQQPLLQPLHVQQPEVHMATVTTCVTSAQATLLGMPDYLVQRSLSSDHGQNAYLMAARQGRTSILRELDRLHRAYAEQQGRSYLAEHRVNGTSRNSALHEAAVSGRVSAIEYLLELKDPHLNAAKDEWGLSPLARVRERLKGVTADEPKAPLLRIEQLLMAINEDSVEEDQQEANKEEDKDPAGSASKCLVVVHVCALNAGHCVQLQKGVCQVSGVCWHITTVNIPARPTIIPHSTGSQYGYMQQVLWSQHLATDTLYDHVSCLSLGLSKLHTNKLLRKWTTLEMLVTLSFSLLQESKMKP